MGRRKEGEDDEMWRCGRGRAIKYGIIMFDTPVWRVGMWLISQELDVQLSKQEA